MKVRLVQSTYRPPEYNGRNFNVWARYIFRQLDKIKGTKIKVN